MAELSKETMGGAGFNVARGVFDAGGGNYTFGITADYSVTGLGFRPTSVTICNSGSNENNKQLKMLVTRLGGFSFNYIRYYNGGYVSEEYQWGTVTFDDDGFTIHASESMGLAHEYYWEATDCPW